MSSSPTVQAFRSSILHCLAAPGTHNPEDACQYFEDGLLIVADGKVEQLGNATDLLSQLPADCKVHEYKDKLIVPGFIDTHIHYPQTDMIASHGEQLLEWLEKYTFPTERKFADAAYASVRRHSAVLEIYPENERIFRCYSKSSYGRVSCWHGRYKFSG